MENENQKQTNWVVPASIIIAGLLIAGAVIYSTGLKNLKPIKETENNQQQAGNQQAENQNNGIKITNNDVILGDPNAPVTIIEFGDFQCPFCAKFFKETEPQIRDNYIKTNKAKMVYKALAILGDESTNSALAALCAKDQGKFWQYHDALFNVEYAELQQVLAGKMQSSEENGNLNRDLFKKIASDLGMDENGFLNCYDSKKYQQAIDDNLDEAAKAMNQRISTPTIFINGQMIQGAQPYSTFSSVIDFFLK